MAALVHNGTSTSQEAAASMTGAAATLRRRVLDAITAAGVHGMTREEIEHATGLSGNTVRPRCDELLRAGLICPSDEIRATKSGRRATVLISTALA